MVRYHFLLETHKMSFDLHSNCDLHAGSDIAPPCAQTEDAAIETYMGRRPKGAMKIRYG